MHRQFRQPLRTLIGAVAAAFGGTMVDAATRLATLLAQPLDAPLIALCRGTPVPLSRPEFDRSAARRLDAVLAQLVARV